MSSSRTPSPSGGGYAITGVAVILILVAAWIGAQALTGDGAGPGAPSAFIAPSERPSAPVEGILHLEIFRVADAWRSPRGWILTDTRGDRVHRLMVDGSYSGTIGGVGDGPGEMRSPMAAVAEGDSIWVLDRRRRSLERFDGEGRFVTRSTIEHSDCSGGIPEGLIRSAGALLVLLVCPRSVPPGISFSVARVTAGDGSIPVLTERGPSFSTRMQPVVPMIGPAVDGFWWALSDRACLRRHDSSGRNVETRCLADWTAISVPDSVRSAIANDPVLASRGLAMQVPEHYPAFDRIFQGPNGDPLVLTVLGEEARALDRVRPDGSLERILDGLPRNTFVDGGEVLAAWEELEGTLIRIYPLPWGP
jgi:hypothetical protein